MYNRYNGGQFRFADTSDRPREKVTAFAVASPLLCVSLVSPWYSRPILSNFLFARFSFSDLLEALRTDCPPATSDQSNLNGNTVSRLRCTRYGYLTGSKDVRTETPGTPVPLQYVAVRPVQIGVI